MAAILELQAMYDFLQVPLYQPVPATASQQTKKKSTHKV